MGIIVLNIVSDIYDPPNKDGIQKLVKKNAICKKTFEAHNISLEHSFTKKGEIDKKVCMIKEGDSYYKVAHKFEEVEKMILPVYIKGFKRW